MCGYVLSALYLPLPQSDQFLSAHLLPVVLDGDFPISRPLFREHIPLGYDTFPLDLIDGERPAPLLYACVCEYVFGSRNVHPDRPR